MRWNKKIFRLETELAKAKAEAVQWVTYDGTPETLPMQGRPVLLADLYGRENVTAYLLYGEVDVWSSLGRVGRYVTPVTPGQQWAYLPTPPKNEG